MDKKTLSSYGWVVVLVLVLACLLAFSTPFGQFIADGFEATYVSFSHASNKAMGEENMGGLKQEWENMLDYSDVTKPKDTPDAIFKEDDGGGLRGELPLGDGPELPEKEIPLPELIEFVGGKFEANLSYEPGYQITTTYTDYVNKLPVMYEKYLWSRWKVTYDGTIDNVISTEPFEMTLDIVDTKYSEYILYDFGTTEALTKNGVKGDSVMLWTIYLSGDDKKDNITYLAAYLNKTEPSSTRYVAKWNGTKYVPVDYNAEINAITNFTKPVEKTKVLETVAPSASTNITYVPIGTFKAKAGMTWREWLSSDYNNSGVDNPVIRNIKMEIVNIDTKIEAGKQYGLYDIDNINRIPAGGTYYVGVTSRTTGDYTGATAVYQAGDAFPSVLTKGDVYVYGDYEYRYGKNYGFVGWTNSNAECADGWGVRVIDDQKTSYGAILTSINEANVKSLSSTFAGCLSLIDTGLPVIPDTVVKADNAFQSCKSLIDLSSYTIPGSVKTATYIFQNCPSLEYGPILCEGLQNLSSGFADCVKLKKMPKLPSTLLSGNLKSIFSGCTLLGY